jgi:peptidyl-dipeptidase A
MKTTSLPFLVAAAVCASVHAAPVKPKPATAAEAKAFVEKLNADLLQLSIRDQTAQWVKNTYITDDTERLAADGDDALLAYQAQALREVQRFRGLKLDAETARTLYLLRVSSPLLAPNDPKARRELTELGSKMEGLYGKGKYCGKDGKGPCRDLEQLSDVMDQSRDWNALLDAWTGWHAVGAEIRPHYVRFVELANQGARDNGFANLGDLWRSGYDMPPADFEKETDRIWAQVKPLYEALHCYVRAKLQDTYGKEHIPDGAPIPAHLLGNMWAQEWTNVYPLVEPYKGASNLDITSALKAKGYDPIKMVKRGEAFYVSLGLDRLPETFWKRSMFTKPADREVVCHASAWDVAFHDDLRIKMCIKVNEEDLVTIHHELGHDYYFHAYYRLPFLFQQGANDGFHEAIGDAIALSVNPGYYKQVGILDAVPPVNEQALINQQMKDALAKVAFLPFGKDIDQYRWGVFSGKIPTSQLNAAWWEIRRRDQGIAPPLPRSEADFDPGAKYHVPANVPYTRYFLARVLQFQFHRALCRAAGYQGPLHACSIYGNAEAGRRLQTMLALGASRPWPEALQALTGERQMDGGALLEYFAPLQAWLTAQNAGRRCGW